MQLKNDFLYYHDPNVQSTIKTEVSISNVENDLMEIEAVVPTTFVITSTVTQEVTSNIDVLPTIHERMEPQVIPSILPQETPSQDHTDLNLPEQFEKFDQIGL